jgi:hypothetical protein
LAQRLRSWKTSMYSAFIFTRKRRVWYSAMYRRAILAVRSRTLPAPPAPIRSGRSSNLRSAQ